MATTSPRAPARGYSASRDRLNTVALGLLDDHARHCVRRADGTEQEDKTDELMAAGGRVMRRG